MVAAGIWGWNYLNESEATPFVHPLYSTSFCCLTNNHKKKQRCHRIFSVPIFSPCKAAQKGTSSTTGPRAMLITTASDFIKESSWSDVWYFRETGCYVFNQSTELFETNICTFGTTHEMRMNNSFCGLTKPYYLPIHRTLEKTKSLFRIGRPFSLTPIMPRVAGNKGTATTTKSASAKSRGKSASVPPRSKVDAEEQLFRGRLPPRLGSSTIGPFPTSMILGRRVILGVIVLPYL